MKKNSFYRLLISLGLLGFNVADDGAGGGDDGAGDDIDDIDVDIDDADDGAEGAGGGKPEPKDDGAGDSPDVKTLQEKIDKLEAKNKEKEDEEQYQQVINGIKADHPDFELSKVEEHLKKMFEEDPEKAKSLNNEAGYRYIHLTQFAVKDVDNEEFYGGRNTPPEDRSDEILEKASSGNMLSIEDEMELYGKHLA